MASLKACCDISKRTVENLSPLDFEVIPNELRKVVHSVNNLLKSLDISLERQKRFTSNAAHELRTPLAGIKVHAQNIPPENERLRRVQRNIILGVDKLTHLFNQLITLSRAETRNYKDKLDPIDLSSLFLAVLDEEYSEAIAAKKLQVETCFSNNLEVLSNKDALSIIIRNLLDNAVKYTPENGVLCLVVGCDETGAFFVVEDNGPGLNENDQTHACERFYRASTPETDGCGLGLSIVHQLCEQFTYSFDLSHSTKYEHGLKATISGFQTVV
ncbi:MAG: sensor histidine kinase [Neptuniibacter sp.]